jgi:phosphate-selective porin OprO/OprP
MRSPCRRNASGILGLHRVLALTLPLLGLAAPEARAQLDEPDYDRLWEFAKLHSGDDDALVQSVALSGRFQFDYAYVDADGESLSDLDLRRMRFGFKTLFRGNLTLHTEAEYDPNGGNLNYLRLTDTYIAWGPSDAFTLTVGKQGASFTMDGQTSSKELITIDRSNLANNLWFPEEYITGVTAGGEQSGFVYEAGFFTSGEKDRGFGDSNGGEFLLLTIGRDLAPALSADRALLRLNYIDNEPDPLNSFTRPFERIVSVNFAFEQPGWGVRSDVTEGRGYLGQSDVLGVMVMPFWNLSERMQLVTRYTWLESDDPNGVRMGRYEREIIAGNGDEYQEIYFGFNYYWYGHKLKLQTGVHQVDMQDVAADGGAHEGWSWTTGFRISW